MGTPDFAVESLRTLVEGKFHVVGVVTMPDKPKGRHGSILQASPVKQYALSQGLPVLQPEKLKDESFIDKLRSLNADLQVVVAFRMLPEIIWNMPKYGTFNLHASLLPQYRGAAPINWAIINGEEETGVTTFFITHEIDTGKIISRERIPINEKDDAGIVHDKLMARGAQLVKETVDLITASEGAIKTTPQNSLYSSSLELKPAPKIFKEACRINWKQTVSEVYDFIRGLSPYPTAWAELISRENKKQSLKIFRSEKVYHTHNLKPGSIHTDGKHKLDIAVQDGFIRILSLQLSGKKRMDTTDFLNGIKIDGRWYVE